MAKRAMAAGAAKSVRYDEPKKLSKWGEWRRANPNGVGLVIHNMRAVMK